MNALPERLHRWDLAPREAAALQQSLAAHVELADGWRCLQSVAGVDVGISDGAVTAAVVVLSLPSLEILEEVRVTRALDYPYVPGLLSFREGPAVLEALARLQRTPDVLLFDGQGYAHPRRMGLATHLGVLLDHPAVGCAKTRLCGRHAEPGPLRGDWSPLIDRDEVVGVALRTRRRVKPVYVSPGHRVSLRGAIEIVLAAGGRYRLPEPTRLAHRLAARPG